MLVSRIFKIIILDIVSRGISMKDVFQETIKRLDNSEPVVIATVIRTKGSTPQKRGAKLLIKQDGSGTGTLGGGCRRRYMVCC